MLFVSMCCCKTTISIKSLETYYFKCETLTSKNYNNKNFSFLSISHNITYTTLEKAQSK